MYNNAAVFPVVITHFNALSLCVCPVDVSIGNVDAQSIHFLHFYNQQSIATHTIHAFIISSANFTLGQQFRTIPKVLLPERDDVTFGCLLSRIRLSVCNVSAPYSWGLKLSAIFLGRPLTSVQNFTETILGEPLRRGRYT